MHKLLEPLSKFHSFLNAFTHGTSRNPCYSINSFIENFFNFSLDVAEYRLFHSNHSPMNNIKTIETTHILLSLRMFFFSSHMCHCPPSLYTLFLAHSQYRFHSAVYFCSVNKLKKKQIESNIRDKTLIVEVQFSLKFRAVHRSSIFQVLTNFSIKYRENAIIVIIFEKKKRMKEINCFSSIIRAEEVKKI